MVDMIKELSANSPYGYTEKAQDSKHRQSNEHYNENRVFRDDNSYYATSAYNTNNGY